MFCVRSDNLVQQLPDLVSFFNSKAQAPSQASPSQALPNRPQVWNSKGRNTMLTATQLSDFSLLVTIEVGDLGVPSSMFRAFRFCLECKVLEPSRGSDTGPDSWNTRMLGIASGFWSSTSVMEDRGGRSLDPNPTSLIYPPWPQG